MICGVERALVIDHQGSGQDRNEGKPAGPMRLLPLR